MTGSPAYCLEGVPCLVGLERLRNGDLVEPGGQ